MPNNPSTRSDVETLELLNFIAGIKRCCALQSRSEMQAASKVVEWLGLQSHHDAQKNWDTLKALSYISEFNDSQTPVLDVGASANSAILKWLSTLGYQQLFACDIRPQDPQKYAKKNIQFSVQNLIATNYPDHFFQVITSISVVEHGVPLEAYAREMSRILRPGGLLLTSTDYWSEPVDCRGIYPYGKEMGPMKVFTRQELEEFSRTANTYGLILCNPLDLNTKEKAVRWERVDRDYTFAFIALRKKT